MVTQKSMMRSGRDHMTAHILHMHDTIPLDAERTDACLCQPFTGHRLYGVSQNLCNLHGRDYFEIVEGSPSQKVIVSSPHEVWPQARQFWLSTDQPALRPLPPSNGV